MSRPCAIVIFGANGDLTKRKLIPALYRLAYDRRLPPGFAIIGNSRTDMSDEAFREKMKESLVRVPRRHSVRRAAVERFFAVSFYFAGDLHDPETYTKLAARLDEVKGLRNTEDNVLFYLVDAAKSL